MLSSLDSPQSDAFSKKQNLMSLKVFLMCAIAVMCLPVILSPLVFLMYPVITDLVTPKIEIKLKR